MTIALIFLVLGQIFFGITNVLWKKPQEETGALSLIVARSFCNLLIFGTITFFLGDFQKFEWQLGLKAILFCFINYFGLFFYLKSLQEKKVSEVVGLSKIGAVFGILIGVFYFKEDLGWIKMSAICLVLLCVFFVENYSLKKENLLSKGFMYVILSSLFWSTFFLFKEPIQQFGIFLFNFILEVVVCLTSFVLLKLNREKLKISPLKNYRKDFSLLVLLGSLAIIFSHYALSELHVTLLAVISLLMPAVTLFVSKFYLKESLTKEQWIGVALGIFALFLMNYA